VEGDDQRHPGPDGRAVDRQRVGDIGPSAPQVEREQQLLGEVGEAKRDGRAAQVVVRSTTTSPPRSPATPGSSPSSPRA
jgi:hypothetical protein